MKKSLRKLIPTFVMLIITAALIGTSTFAWFSMNTTVTATGMNITATSESKFLQIITATGSFDDAAAQSEASATNATKAVRPTSAVKAFTDTTITALTAADDSGDIKFVEAFSNSPASYARSTNYIDVTTAAKATDATNVYTLINDFKVRLNPATGVTSATNLTVSGVTIASDNATPNNAMLTSVRVLIVCGDEWALWGSTGAVVSSNSNIIAATVTDDTDPNTATDVKVYVFFDGEQTATTTNNAATLDTDGYDVSITFTIA